MKIRIEKATPEKLAALGAGSWSPWECEPTEFDWKYDEEEVAYVKEGRVEVSTAEGTVEIKAGDIVTFPAGLACRWKVIKTIKKVYSFR